MTTWNSADNGSNIALTNGDLTAVCSDPTALRFVRSTTGKTTGKWYFEVLCNPIVASFANRQAMGGIAQASVDNQTELGSDVTELSFELLYNSDNTSWHVAHGSGGNDIGGPTPTQGDIVGVGLDLNNNFLYFLTNGVDLNGDIVAGTDGYSISAGTWYAAASGRIISSTPGQITANFGATASAYGPPSGYSWWDTYPPFAVSTPFFTHYRQMVGS